jgi:hypothetical protein
MGKRGTCRGATRVSTFFALYCSAVRNNDAIRLKTATDNLKHLIFMTADFHVDCYSARPLPASLRRSVLFRLPSYFQHFLCTKHELAL